MEPVKHAKRVNLRCVLLEYGTVWEEYKPQLEEGTTNAV